MNKFLHTLALFFLTCFIFETRAQNISNEGSDFWLAFPTHDPSSLTNLANMNIFVASKENSEVTVSCGTYTETKSVIANTITTFSVPRNVSYIDRTESNAVVSNKAIRVSVTAGKPKVAVYAHVFAGARSAASLILPIEALGQKYYSMNYTQDASGTARNFLTLVAVEDDTKLILHQKNGTDVLISLPKKGDVYEYLPTTTEDLTGTYVEVDTVASACKKFAAFSGSTSLIINCNGSRDPIFQQLYTVNSWGKNYGVVPFINRKYILRVLAQEDNTKIYINGSLVSTINKGVFYQPTSPFVDAVIVTSDKLISVAQYSLTQACSGVTGGAISGDPEMVLLNPTEFNIKNVTLFSATQIAISARYINVFMKTAKTSTFKVNGLLPPSGSWLLMPSDPTYSYAQIAVGQSSLTLTADDGFNSIAYGFGEFESYAYSAGTNLASTQFLLLQNKITNTETTAACIGQAVDFKVTLPYLLTKIVWKFSDGSADVTDNSPTFTQAVVNGQILYTYLSPLNKVYTTQEKIQVSAIATLSPTAGSCSTSDIEFVFNFDSDPLPTANFEANPEGCEDKIISFTDKSTTNVVGKSITKWLWDFGDGNTSTEQNPSHIYKTFGNIKVKLAVASESGCYSNVFEKDILIHPKVVSSFKVNQTTCVNTQISFMDASTVATGNIVKWVWDMGDGKGTLEKLDNLPFLYEYNTPSNYKVRLITYSDKGCVSLPFELDVDVSVLPTNDFFLPDVCLSDGPAVFVNASKDVDGSTTNLTYLWDFGDPASGTLNSSTAKDGSHKYNAAGTYNVALTITNANRCVVKLEKAFTVNGAFPVAAFDIVNASNLCSNTNISLINTSTVDFGSVTKIEWYLDGVKHSEDTNPLPNKLYDFAYPQFTAPLTKNLTVKMLVYSGGICSNEITKNLTILAAPVVSFDALAPVCLNRGSFQLQATELAGLAGSGIFSGPGVTPSGIFDPELAGVGIHQIVYTFTTASGCLDSKTQAIEVYPIPTVDAGADFFILIGGEKKIDAKAEGLGVTYKWTPAIGLDKDDILNPVANPEQDITYTLTVTSLQGCTVVDRVFVRVLQNVTAPNSFSPNGDGINDVWNIKYLDTYPNSSVEIYNRNGERVYYSKGYANPFDGNYNNRPLPVGTYYYIINPNSGRKSITGSLTIIR